MKRYKIQILSVIAVAVLLTSCIGDLDVKPLNKQQITAATIFDDPAAYKEFLAKLYASMTLTGQLGQFGQPEISAPDEGTTSFMRMLFTATEISTDEVICAWGDAAITEFHTQSWSSQNGYLKLLYNRIFINIAYCNEFIRQVQPRISGLSSDLQAEANHYIAEARFLRAYFYYSALDLFGNVPFVTEADAVGPYLPKQIKRADLFAYVESELKAIDANLPAPGQNEYARADQAAAWSLLARLYLNAKVYTGAEHNDDCIAYCNKVMGAGYSLNPSYENLFRADNDKLRNEIIFPIAEDGANGQGYGGVTYIIHAEVGGSMDAGNDFGIASGGWSGNRPTNTFVNLFADKTGSTDSRALFYTAGQTLDITLPLVFTQGYLCTKWRNVTSTGAVGQDGTFVDTDFPVFRLADIYLMYAEATVRGGSTGTKAHATELINLIRTRAYGDNSGNIAEADLNLQFLLDERGREMYWETTRRSDLIRFGKFTGDAYLWDWKGNAKDGLGTDDRNNIFPLPSSDLAVNTNLVQNSGY